MPVKGFFINLDGSDERRRQTELELQKLNGLGHYQRFAAIDGRAEEGWSGVQNRGELGCFLSHLEAIRQSAGCSGWLHVVEDDVIVSRFAADAISGVTANADLDRLDVIFTNVLFGDDPWFVAAVREAFDANVVTDPSGEVTAVDSVGIMPFGQHAFFSTTSYLVNPRSIARTAELLAQRLESGPFAAIDVTFSELSRAGKLSIGCTVPFLTMPRLDWRSTIREGVSLWAASHQLMTATLFADRDLANVRRLLAELGRVVGGSVTSELLGEAQRLMFRGRPQDAVRLGESDV